MRFLLDMNLPLAIADRLPAEGHDAVHALVEGFAMLPDREIFERAAADRRVVVTFDLDFGEISWSAASGNCGVLLLRLKRAPQSHLWKRLSVAISQAGDALETGAVVLVGDARIRVKRPRSQ
jgi:predicted nuclease of predicted toxin-antitoxin system